jgi:hypothetical protein
VRETDTETRIGGNRIKMMLERKKTKIMIAGLLMTAFFVGCTEKKVEFSLHKRTPQESALIALKSDHADDRYRCLVELEKSKAFQADWAIKAMAVIAKSDPSSSVRALAVHNLGRLDNPEVWPVLVQSLDDPDDRVRFEAAWGLSQNTLTKTAENGESFNAVVAALLRGLSGDRNVDVRLNSARALGQVQDTTVLMALVAALKDTDFSVRYEAEKSLIRLTGRTFQGNAQKWLAWISETNAPFADAGKTPSESALPRQNVFEKTRDSFHRFYEEWQGPAKK